MKKISINETQKFCNSDKCIATEYPFEDKDIDISTATINGRYPETGKFCVNDEVKEMIYVIEGFGKICKIDECFEFEAGDAIFIDKGEKYYWDANCKVVVACSPAWYQEQHRILEYPKMQLSQL